MKQYRVSGNNLKMEMYENRHKLKIIGNNNSMKIEKNFGSVIMVGNNCCLDVIYNSGSVTNIGDSGTMKSSDFESKEQLAFDDNSDLSEDKTSSDSCVINISNDVDQYSKSVNIVCGKIMSSHNNAETHKKNKTNINVHRKYSYSK